MKVKYIIEEDFINYYKPALFIGTNQCDFKCNKDAGKVICQNYELLWQPDIIISAEALVHRYLSNPITKAIVFGGLEPFLSIDDILDFINVFRKSTNDDIIIYTGYTETEVQELFSNSLKQLLMLNNVIIKYGRYKEGFKPHLDPILKVTLASDNQYAVKY